MDTGLITIKQDHPCKDAIEVKTVENVVVNFDRNTEWHKISHDKIMVTKD